MSKVLKSEGQNLTEPLLMSLVGKYIHIDVNKHPSKDQFGRDIEVNVWFAGEMAGYDRVTMFFDKEQNRLDFPIISYNLILTDGMAYSLSPTQLSILELTAEEFNKLVDDCQLEQAVKDSILIPGRDF